MTQPPTYNSIDKMYQAEGVKKAEAAAEQDMLEKGLDRDAIDAIMTKRRDDRTRSKHDRAIDEDDYRKAVARIEAHRQGQSE